MVNQRLKRVILGTVLPAPLGTVLVLAESFIDEGLPVVMRGDRADGMLETLLYAGLGAVLMLVSFTLLAFLLVGVQSFLCAIIMERAINPRVESKRIALGLAGFLGLLTALSLHRILDKSDVNLNILLAGTLVGMLVGAILRRSYCRFPPSKESM